MKKTRRPLLSFLKSVLLVELALLPVAAALWLVLGGRTLVEYGNALVLTGFLSGLLGMFSLFGGWDVTRSFEFQQAETVGAESIFERTQRHVREELEQGYGCLILMGCAGLVAVSVGTLIRVVLG